MCKEQPCRTALQGRALQGTALPIVCEAQLGRVQDKLVGKSFWNGMLAGTVGVLAGSCPWCHSLARTLKVLPTCHPNVTAACCLAPYLGVAPVGCLVAFLTCTSLSHYPHSAHSRSSPYCTGHAASAGCLVASLTYISSLALLLKMSSSSTTRLLAHLPSRHTGLWVCISQSGEPHPPSNTNGCIEWRGWSGEGGNAQLSEIYASL